MSKPLVTFLLFFAVILLGISGGPGVKAEESTGTQKTTSQTLRQVQTELVTRPHPPQVGTNDVFVRLAGTASGPPLGRASVKLEAALSQADKSSKGDKSGPEIHVINLAPAEKPFEFWAKITFPAPGLWHMKLIIMADGDQDSRSFNLEVIAGGQDWSIMVGFLGAILVVVIGALVLKSRIKTKEEIGGA